MAQILIHGSTVSSLLHKFFLHIYVCIYIYTIYIYNIYIIHIIYYIYIYIYNVAAFLIPTSHVRGQWKNSLSYNIYQISGANESGQIVL